MKDVLRYRINNGILELLIPTKLSDKFSRLLTLRGLDYAVYHYSAWNTLIEINMISFFDINMLMEIVDVFGFKRFVGFDEYEQYQGYMNREGFISDLLIICWPT